MSEDRREGECPRCRDEPARHVSAPGPWKCLAEAESQRDALSVRLAQAERAERDFAHWRTVWRERAEKAEARLAQECALRAQAEQQITTDAHTIRVWRRTIERLEPLLRASDALKREYEEALMAIALIGKGSRTVPSLQRIALDALAASGERSDTAEAGGREAPDTKEPR